MKKQRQFICILFGFALFILIYYKTGHNISSISYTTTDISLFTVPEFNISNSAFLVDTSVCKIPNIDPFDKSVKHLLDDGSMLHCENEVDIVYVEGNSIHINWTEINQTHYKNRIKYCRYNVIWRPYDIRKHNNYFKYKNMSKPFTSFINVFNDEFVRVKCYSGNGSVHYINFFSFVHLKKDVETRCDTNYKQTFAERTEQLSVLMLGVDSISRVNMMRYMKETRSYLFDKMDAIELLGYNKVADNTFVNIVPMTSGKYVHELPWNESVRWTPMDEYNFVWNNYSENGFRTLYVEDAPDIAIFDYGKSGFEKPPADYFNRHFSLVMESHKRIWNTNNNCIHGRPETEVVLDYMAKFCELFKKDPYFAFGFITRLTHSYLEESKKADTLYKNFFQTLHRKNILQNTIVFFFSDHGMRFGDVRETFLGKLEERLPYMFILFPQWFLRKYPQVHRNLKINSRRLTTPFDIYTTLTHILKFKGDVSNQKKERGMSLLKEIPESRTCEDAEILPHWCTCSQHETLDVKNETIIKVGSALVEKINSELETVLDVCEKLSLKSMRYAHRILPSEKVLRLAESKNDVIGRTEIYGDRVDSYVDYQITLQTKPGGGVFEGTLRYDEKEETYDLVGDISRINKYGNQSYCVDRHHLKKLCYCKNQQT